MTMDAILARALFIYDPTSGTVWWKDPSRYNRVKRDGIAGTTDHEGYRVLRYKGKGYKAHRIIWLYMYGVEPAGLIDHIDGDKSNNRFDNLRDASHLLNCNNLTRPSATSRSGYRGVSWFSQYQKWKGSFSFNGRNYFVGHFDDPAEAHVAVEALRKRLYSEAGLSI